MADKVDKSQYSEEEIQKALLQLEKRKEAQATAKAKRQKMTEEEKAEERKRQNVSRIKKLAKERYADSQGFEVSEKEIKTIAKEKGWSIPDKL